MNDTDRENLKHSDRNLYHCRFAHTGQTYAVLDQTRACTMSVYLPACYRGGPGLILGQPIYDFWWKKGLRDRVFFPVLCFSTVSVMSPALHSRVSSSWPGCLTPGEELPLGIDQKAGWAAEIMWAVLRRENILPDH